MNVEQYKRYKKMINEPITCLYKMRDQRGNMHFLISGSISKKYKVSVEKDTGKITCTCPDFEYGAKLHNCICKHCLFVIYRVLTLFSDINHTFFTRLFFTPDEIYMTQKSFKES